MKIKDNKSNKKEKGSDKNEEGENIKLPGLDLESDEHWLELRKRRNKLN